MSESGAKAALKGYRLQALYTLFVILKESEEGIIFQPEGKEDLAILKDNTLVKTIQVKAYKDSLQLSSFSPDKKESFFHRAVNLIKNGCTEIKVVSFGEVGPELLEAWEKDSDSRKSIFSKLKKIGFSNEDCNLLISNLKWVKVDEAFIENEVFEFLQKTLAGGDPENAFNLLVAWLYRASEDRSLISFSLLKNRLTSVGKYFAEREAHHKEWFNSIVPYEETYISFEEKKALQKEFFRGVACRYKHILANLDVPRKRFLEKIDNEFRSGKRIVVLHGASGQGKTALALRYLHDFVPNEWKFAIRFVKDQSHAAQIAIALSEHLKLFEAPMYIYIDVSPRDAEWASLLGELVRHFNIRILVSIREEDLVRNPILESDYGSITDIELFLGKEEAEWIFNSLTHSKEMQFFPSFETAWCRFGNSGPLLEFVYFLTHTNTLKERLASQIKALRSQIVEGLLDKNTLKLVQCCAIATSFEARVKISDISRMLAMVDPIGTLELLEREYFLRLSDDRLHITALHPVRSQIITELTSDPALTPWFEAAKLTLNCINSEDLGVFLLYVFSRNFEEASGLLPFLKRIKVSNWFEVSSIAKALIWFGIKNFISENRALFDEADQILPDSWYYFLNSNIAQIKDSIDSKSLFEILAKKRPEIPISFQEIDRRVVGIDLIYSYLNDWLNSIESVELPTTDRDWEGLGEIAFLIGHFSLNGSSLLNFDLMKTSWNNASTIAKLKSLEGLRLVDKEKEEIVTKDFFATLINSVRKENRLIALIDRGDLVKINYILDLDVFENRKNENDHSKIESKLNDDSVKRIKLVEKLFPCKKRFFCEGHGLILELFKQYNPTKKELLPKSFPNDELVSINSMYINLLKWEKRPATWKHFGKQLLEIREIAIDALTTTIKFICKFYSNKITKLDSQNLSDIVAQADEATGRLIMLPKVSVDEWGVISEGQLQGKDFESRSKRPYNAQKNYLIKKYELLLTPVKDYLHNLNVFFRNNLQNLIERWRNLEGDKRKNSKEKLSFNLTVRSLFDAWNAVSKVHNVFDTEFLHIYEQRVFNRIKRKEKEVLPTVWILYFSCIYDSKRRWDFADIRAKSKFEQAKNEVKNLLMTMIVSKDNDSWTLKVLDKKIFWEEKETICIKFQLNKFEKLNEGLSCCLEILKKFVIQIEENSLEEFAISKICRQIIIVPVINNFSLAKLCWIIPYLPIGSENCNLAKDLKGIIMDKDFFSNFELEVLEDSIATRLVRLKDILSKVLLYFSQLKCFVQIPKIDSIGKEILQEYSDEIANKLSLIVSKLVREIDDIVGIISANAAFDGHVDLRNLLSQMSAFFSDTFTLENKSVIGFEDCKAISELLEKCTEIINVSEWQYIREKSRVLS